LGFQNIEAFFRNREDCVSGTAVQGVLARQVAAIEQGLLNVDARQKLLISGCQRERVA
jgi:hypothetical protein